MVNFSVSRWHTTVANETEVVCLNLAHCCKYHTYGALVSLGAKGGSLCTNVGFKVLVLIG